jgi:Protein NO VEIN, C-terminal
VIPTNEAGILDAALEILLDFGTRTGVRGRFVALYLGLRRMGDRLPGLGEPNSRSASEIEEFLDRMYTKRHRDEPFVVLTALFGGSTSPSAPYSTRTGVTAPGHRYPTNTWRNNFNIQKGIGCPAEPATIQAMLNNPAGRLACPHMREDPEGRHVCSVADTNYRGEEHSIWLRMTGGGYQKVDLNLPAVTRDYLIPSGQRIPVFALIAALYCMSPVGVFPERAVVGIPDFAADFDFTLDQVQALFDCEPTSHDNADLLARLGVPVLRPVAVPSPAPRRRPQAREEEPAPEQLPALTPAGEINTGVAAELAVAEELSGQGWEVKYRGNQPVGFDLEARKGADVLRVEVKSSVGFTQPELTSSEWEAAQRYGEEYVLAVVDFVRSEARAIWYVRDPAAATTPIQRTQNVYRLPRPELVAVKTEPEFL